ncbi:hypothetical protein SB758_34545, partial [Burkholderia sp. SIMBA_013]
GQTVTATVKYEVKQPDIDAGHLLNSVTVGGTHPSGVPLAPPPVAVDTALTPNVGLQFAKAADVGFWAPVMLVALRFIQGFALGGEWGGAVL